jgi:hypothetical protein
VKQLAWGMGGMCEGLQPNYQFFHDVLDFRARSHHELKKPHMLFKTIHQWGNGRRRRSESSSRLLTRNEARCCVSRSWSTRTIITISVAGLKNRMHGSIPKNVEFWTEMHSRVYESIRAGVEQPNYFQLMLEAVDPDLLDAINILDPDESFIICPDRAGGIESGMHGHAGPNGSRGTPLAFAKLGRKANIGHFHSASIIDGVYVGGTCSRLDPDWTTGPSSWSHSHIVTYKNGKRAIITMWSGKWRA